MQINWLVYIWWGTLVVNGLTAMLLRDSKHLRKANEKICKMLNLMILTLRKKCPYSKLFWSAFSPHFPAFGLNAERYRLSLRIQSECGKNADQNNSEYELFLRSVSLQLFKKLSSIILLGWFLNKIPMNWMDWKR